MNTQITNRVESGVPLRHWSRQSQPIAPAEILVNRLQNGWQLSPVATCQQHHYGPGRTIDIYTFTLTQNGDVLQLPVRANPVVHRIIREHNLEVVNQS
ncbi:MAG: hypothetical protein CUN55_06035 [Phototrophicales bacterium]|nr:MAG: hypothetical protein CUN55_06035 [Phototrophicales bacterium]